MNDFIFYDIALIVIIAAIGGYLAKLFKQPLIPAYIIMGILFGPSVLGLITDTEIISTLAELGIAFLLFVVGLELDWSRLKTASTVAVFGGLLQMSILFFVGFLLSLLLSFIVIEAVYLGLILTFSSTLVIVKILSDKKEIDTLHGRILIGMLLLQDLVAIIAISILTTLNNFSPLLLLFALFKGVGIVVIAYFLSKFVFPTLYKIASNSNEVLLLMSITVCFFFSLLANAFGFSIAIGGFVAGITLANLPYNFEIIARIKPLRDFFSTLFFVSLGMSFSIATIPKLIIPIIVFLIFVGFFQAFITMIIVKTFGYTTKTSFFTGLTLAQVSEFSFIIAALGLSLRHISESVFSLTVILAVISIAVTSYYLRYDHAIYRKLSPYLKFFNKFGGTHRDLGFSEKSKPYEVVIIGIDRIGHTILESLRKQKKKILVIDYNPEMIRKCNRESIPALYGDIEDLDIVERIDFNKAKLIISTIEDKKTSMFLARYVKKKNKDIILFVTGRRVEDALQLYSNGADYVILPYDLGGDHVSLLLEETSFNMQDLLLHRKKHIKQLQHNIRSHFMHNPFKPRTS